MKFISPCCLCFELLPCFALFLFGRLSEERRSVNQFRGKARCKYTLVALHESLAKSCSKVQSFPRNLLGCKDSFVWNRTKNGFVRFRHIVVIPSQSAWRLIAISTRLAVDFYLKPFWVSEECSLSFAYKYLPLRGSRPSCWRLSFWSPWSWTRDQSLTSIYIPNQRGISFSFTQDETDVGESTAARE